MTPLQRYLAEEVAEDHVDGLITRREALRRLGLLGLGVAAAGSLIAACAKETKEPAAAPSPAATGKSGTPAIATEDIEFDGPRGKLFGAWAEAQRPAGAVLVIHENRGLTDHIRNVAGRFGAAGYSAIAVDLLSEEGGTKKVGGEAEAMAALASAPEERLVADMKGALGELGKRLPDAKYAAIGFCFGGGMVWRLLASGEPRLAAAAPFYGPGPDDPDFSGSKNAAVLGIYAELDDRVNASRDSVEAALTKAGLIHQIVTIKDADHAFFNDTGMRYNAAAAANAWARVLGWFGKYLA